MRAVFVYLFSFFVILGIRAQEVTSLTLINSSTDQDIRDLSLVDTIDISKTGNMLNIRANTTGTIGSVRFAFDGNANFKTEGVAPYAFNGDNNGDYADWTPSLGNHTLKASAYSGTGATGTLLSEFTVVFVVIQGDDPNGGELTPPSNPGTGEVSITGELKKWHKITLSFDGPEYAETDRNPNPFLDFRLNVEFTNGDETFVVPGYFAADGNAAETSAEAGNVWRVHFSPNKEGEWSYKASFRLGREVAASLDALEGSAIAPMDGKTGVFTVAANDKTGIDLRAKGRLSYVGQHYLQFEETGEYFLKGGADAPENLLAYADFDNTPNEGNRRKTWAPHVNDWQAGDPTWKSDKGKGLIGAVNYLASEGLNVFSFLTMNINGDDKNVYPYLDNKTYDQFDCSKLDQWGIVFDHATTKGMYLHFKTQETENELLLDGGNVGVQRKIYYRELVARFGHHLALNWNLGEENNDQSDAQRKEMAQYFYDIDPYHHNVVIHTYPGEHSKIYTPLLGSASKLTGVSIQTGWNTVHSSTVTWVNNSAAAGKKWVVANDEQGSANVGVPDDTYTGAPSIDEIRQQTLWGNLMGGGAGVEYYFGYSLPNSDLNAEDFRSRDRSWDYIRLAHSFFKDNAVAFWQMSPNDALVSKGWCLANEGIAYVVYLPDGGTCNLTLNTGVNFDVKWYDPRNGGQLLTGSVSQISGSGAKSIGNAPSSPSEDWVVYITKAGGLGKLPVAQAGSDKTSGPAPLIITFNADGSSDDDGQIVTYSWEFGDGQSANGMNVVHTYASAGEYTAILTVTDNDGNKASDVIQISVESAENQIDCAQTPFVEKDGILVVEVESVPAASGWLKQSTVAGFTGDAYYHYNGVDRYNAAGSGLIQYKIYINNPGVYHFRWHNKIMLGTSTTDSNDSWLRIPDADDFFAKNGTSIKYPKGGKFVQSNVVVEGTSTNGWMKVYCSGTTAWTWSCRTSDSDPHEIYATFNKAGVYTIQISARSKGHAVDRFVLFQDSKYSVAQATNKALAETRCMPNAINDIKSVDTKLAIYPNPAKDVLWIENNTNEEIVALQMTDLTGKIILSSSVSIQNGNSHQLHMNAVSNPNGLYLMNITTASGNHILKKVIVKN